MNVHMYIHHTMDNVVVMVARLVVVSLFPTILRMMDGHSGVEAWTTTDFGEVTYNSYVWVQHVVMTKVRNLSL